MSFRNVISDKGGKFRTGLDKISPSSNSVVIDSNAGNNSVKLFRNGLGKSQSVTTVEQSVIELVRPQLFRNGLGKSSPIVTTTTQPVIEVVRPQLFRTGLGKRSGGSEIAADPTGEILRVGGLIKPRARIAINQTATLNTATFLIEFKAVSVSTSQDLLNNTTGGTEKPRITFASSYLFFYYFGGTTLFTLRSSQLLVNNTNYKAMVRINGLNSGNLYLNSVLGTVLSNNAASIPSFNQEYMIGGWPHNLNPWDFLGTISSLRIFNRALTDTEAASLGFL